MTADSEHQGEDQDKSEEEDKPVGTLFIMICFLIMLVGMWSWVYFEMIVG